jgi:hypothetical protein
MFRRQPVKWRQKERVMGEYYKNIYKCMKEVGDKGSTLCIYMEIA